MMNANLGILLLKIGVAFGFFYAAIAGFIAPNEWISWLPTFIQQPIFLNLFGIIEILIGLWLISGYQTFWAALLSGLMLTGIVIFNLHLFVVVFRDVGLALTAFALALFSKKAKI